MAVPYFRATRFQRPQFPVLKLWALAPKCYCWNLLDAGAVNMHTFGIARIQSQLQTLYILVTEEGKRQEAGVGVGMNLINHLCHPKRCAAAPHACSLLLIMCNSLLPGSSVIHWESSEMQFFSHPIREHMISGAQSSLRKNREWAAEVNNSGTIHGPRFVCINYLVNTYAQLSYS